MIDYVDARLAAGDPIGIASLSLLEVFYGLRLKADAGDARFLELLNWFQGFLDEGRVELLPLTARAAVVAGEIRARRRVPPPASRGSRRSRTEARAAWVMDIEIAATAWTAGRDIVSADRHHFETIADVLEDLAPKSRRLDVLPPPV